MSFKLVAILSHFHQDIQHINGVPHRKQLANISGTTPP